MKPKQKQFDRMSNAEFEQYLLRKLDPCKPGQCYAAASVLVSYPSADGRLRYCVCTRCGSYFTKAPLAEPAKPAPIRYMTEKERKNQAEIDFLIYLREMCPTPDMAPTGRSAKPRKKRTKLGKDGLPIKENT